MFLFGWVVLDKNDIGVKFIPFADYFLDHIVNVDIPNQDYVKKYDKINPENSPHRIQELYINR